MTDLTAAYRRLYKFLDRYTSSQFISAVQEVNPNLLDFNEYIEKRGNEEKSVTQKDYFKDILLLYPDDINHYHFEIFLKPLEATSPDEVKDIRIVIGNGKVDISKVIYPKAVTSKEIDDNLIADTIKELQTLPEANNLYNRAFKLFNNGNNERHILDNIRLSLKNFLRSKSQNDKTLINRIPFLGKYIKGKGFSSEIRNTFQGLKDLFRKYQNNYAKNHNKVNHAEILFILNLTNTFFGFLFHINYGR